VTTQAPPLLQSTDTVGGINQRIGKKEKKREREKKEKKERHNTGFTSCAKLDINNQQYTYF
jgi:hypothetical protein